MFEGVLYCTRIEQPLFTVSVTLTEFFRKTSTQNCFCVSRVRLCSPDPTFPDRISLVKRSCYAAKPQTQ